MDDGSEAEVKDFVEMDKSVALIDLGNPPINETPTPGHSSLSQSIANQEDSQFTVNPDVEKKAESGNTDMSMDLSPESTNELHPEDSQEPVPHTDHIVDTVGEEAGEIVGACTSAITEIDADTSVPSTSIAFSERVELTNVQNIDEEEKPVKFGKICDPQTLGCCEFCGGPVKRRRFCSPLKKFCSKGCSRSSRKAKKKEMEDIVNGQESADEGSSYTCSLTGREGETPHKVTWGDYMEAALSKAAPDCCFKYTTTDVPGLKPGMKLEAVDRNNPPSFCVATVIQQVGHRVRIRYDGFGKDSSNDCWCNFQAEELHPIGWCAQNGYPLQPPKGINSTLEDWRTFLTQTLTGALAAPHDLFRKTQEHFQPRVHGFEIGMKLEVVHRVKPSIICPATVTKSLGPYYFAITTDYQDDVPSVTFCSHSDSPGIFPPGWCYRHQVELAVPANYTKKTFAWDKYLALCRAPYAPAHLFRKMKAHKFKPGMKVEVVDLEQPHVIRVATITNILGRMLQLFFDGHQKFQFVDFESPDIYPIGWCKRTGHPLLSPFGRIPSDSMSLADSELDTLDLPSFLEVMGRQSQSQAGQSAGGLLPRKTSLVSKLDKDDKSAGEESDISDDDTGSERFYHNKNQIFFNKSCCYGPLLDPDKVSQLPEATPPGKVSSVIRTGLEMVAKAAFDPEKVIDLMQEGCGVRVVVKHKGKIFKKAISRVDSRPKLERYLKRFCRRLICCEFFLSLKPVPTPCPDQCQADDQGNLQGPKGLKAKRSREYFEVKHLGVEKKKRGRKRKSEYLLPGEPNSIVTRPLVDNAVSMPGASFSVVEGQRISSAVTTIAHVQNGSTVSQGASVVSPPVVTLAPVSIGNPRFQGPANPSAPRPTKPVKTIPMLAPQGKLPMVQSHRAPIPFNALPGGKPVMKEGLLPHTSPSMPNVTLTDGSSRIVTNVSSQRFETSATSSGTTITFGRAPPNVTISNCVPPPLTKIATESRSSHVTTTANLTIEQPNQLPIHAVSAVQTASSNSVLPPYSSGSAHAPPMSRPSYSTVTVGQMPGYRPATSPPIYPRQVFSASPGGVIRHPGVHPNSSTKESAIQVKPSSGTAALPPPLVSNPRLPLKGVRPQGMYVPPQSNSATPLSQPRPALPSHPTSYAPLPVRTGVINHRPQGNAPPPLSSSSGGPNAHLQVGAREKGLSQPGPPPMSQRPIMPNYHGIPRSINLPRNSSPSIRFSNVRTSLGSGFGRQLPPPIRPQGTGPGVLQQSFKLRFTVPTVSGTVQQRNVESKPPVTFVDSSLVPNSRVGPTPIKPKTSIEHLQALTNATNQAAVTEEPKAKEEQPKVTEGEGNAEESGEKPGSRPKKNLWWLKKKRRKRARLTYIKTKYRRKDDEVVPSTSEIAPMEVEVEDEPELDLEDGLPNSSLGERPKRGRPPKGVGFRFKADSISNSDPDWDETEERRRVKPVVKKKKGRVKKESTEVSSPKLKSPSLDGSSQMPGLSGLNMVREAEDSSFPVISSMVRSPPVSPRSMQRAHTVYAPGVAADKRGTTPKGSMSKMMRMNSGPDGRGHHSAARFSPYPSPTSSAVLHSSSGHRSSCPKPLCVDVGTNTSLPGCVNGRSPDLPANPVTWSVEQVVKYVRSTDCINYANIFSDQEIDGKALMLLSRDSLMQFTRMKLGPTLKMCSYIAQLKLRAR